MNPPVASEDTLVEQPAIARLCDLHGWTHVHGVELAPDAPAGERKLWSDVVLVGRLRRAVARINPQLTSEAVQRVVEIVLTSTSPSVIEDHRGFHELLLSGVQVAWVDSDGVRRDDYARLVDFEEPGNNEFVAANQITIIEGAKNRRPDILLFVNGLPLGQIELKAPGRKNMAQEVVNQLGHYTETIPRLYRFVEIIGASDLISARVGTITTPVEHFAEWKTMAEDDGGRRRPQLELMIDGVFAPARFLELIRDFVFFETDGARTTKVMAKYHQVAAVNAAVESVARAMGGDRRGGVIWHTQGSGKSYTMVFFVTRLRRDPRFQNPTVVAVTDRTDLDDQLAGSFSGATHLAAVCRQAEQITGGSQSLHALLQVPAGGIVFTTIQKFAPAKGEAMPVLSQRSNVIVMADEAHRSQYAQFAQNITVALPNAVRVGFTGTPVERIDHSTRLVFGDYVSVYRMRQAQEDQATVPIYYESRQVPVAIEDPDELRRVEEVLEDEEAAAANKLVTSWAKLEKVVGAEDRLRAVAEDISAHFKQRQEVMVGKAMVVAYSRRVAADLTGLLRERLGEQLVDCVISANATDPQELARFRRSKPELKELAKRFRDPEDPLRLVVVKDMWLTGFDAPVLNTLYVDKPMRDHGLLQAIARVNRVFRDKPGGLVVDYIGIGEDLRSSLSAYDQSDIDEPLISIDRAVAGMTEKYEVICALLHPIGYQPGQLTAATAPTVFVDAYNLLLDDEHTQSFLDAQVALRHWYALARTEPAAIAIRDEVGLFNMLAVEIRKITTPGVQASPAAEQAVKQFFSEGLAAGEIVDVFGIADKDRPELSVLSDEFLESITGRTEHPNIQIKLLEKLLGDEIRGRLRNNRMQAKLFSQEVHNLLARYELKQLTSAEVVARLVEIARQLRAARRRHEQLGLSVEEAAFYDALAGGVQDVNADPELAKIAHELVQSIRNDLSVDWADRQSTEALIRVKIKRLLRKHSYTPPAPVGGGGGIDQAAQIVLDQAKALYRYWPEVDVGDQLFL